MNSEFWALGLQIVYSVGSFVLGYFWTKSRALSARQAAMEDGTRALLKMELCRIHRESIQQGTLSYDNESIAEEIYAAYHSLGGNGQGTTMINDIRKLMMGGHHG